MWEKLKSFLADDALYFSALLLLVAVSSFGLGRQSVALPASKNVEKQASIGLSVLPPATTGVIPQKSSAGTQNPMMTDQTNVAVVASKSGTKYHLPSCAGAKSIKPENLITFDSIEAAQAAGYTPAANCKGLGAP